MKPIEDPREQFISVLIDWTVDTIEALQVGDIERAQRDLLAIHDRLLAELGR